MRVQAYAAAAAAREPRGRSCDHGDARRRRRGRGVPLLPARLLPIRPGLPLCARLIGARAEWGRRRRRGEVPGAPVHGSASAALTLSACRVARRRRYARTCCRTGLSGPFLHTATSRAFRRAFISMFRRRRFAGTRMRSIALPAASPAMYAPRWPPPAARRRRPAHAAAAQQQEAYRVQVDAVQRAREQAYHDPQRVISSTQAAMAAAQAAQAASAPQWPSAPSAGSQPMPYANAPPAVLPAPMQWPQTGAGVPAVVPSPSDAQSASMRPVVPAVSYALGRVPERPPI